MSGRNDFKALPDELKPREQLLRAASPRDVSDAALLAVMLKTGSRGCDVGELARRLLRVFGSLHALVRADVRQWIPQWRRSFFQSLSAQG